MRNCVGEGLAQCSVAALAIHGQDSTSRGVIWLSAGDEAIINAAFLVAVAGADPVDQPVPDYGGVRQLPDVEAELSWQAPKYGKET